MASVIYVCVIYIYLNEQRGYNVPLSLRIATTFYFIVSRAALKVIGHLNRFC